MYGLVDGTEEAIKNLLAAGIHVPVVVDLLKLRGVEVSRSAVEKLAQRSRPPAVASQNNLRAKLLLKTWNRINALEEAVQGETDSDTLRELRQYIKLAVEILAEIDRWAMAQKPAESQEENEKEEDFEGRF